MHIIYWVGGKDSFSIIKKERGKKKEREKCFELAEQNILIELIKKKKISPKKKYQNLSRDGKIYPALNLRGRR